MTSVRQSPFVFVFLTDSNTPKAGSSPSPISWELTLRTRKPVCATLQATVKIFTAVGPQELPLFRALL